MGSGKETPELKPKYEKEQKLELAKYTILEIDSLFDKGVLTKKTYPNMSRCGGGLAGFYFNNELKLINSKYQAELGYSSQKIYWDKNKMVKIIYREYFAEWEKYEKNYPPEKVEFCASKMTCLLYTSPSPRDRG